MELQKQSILEPKTPAKLNPVFSRRKNLEAFVGGESSKCGFRELDNSRESVVDLESPCFHSSCIFQNNPYVDCCGINQEKSEDNGNPENSKERSQREKQKMDSKLYDQKKNRPKVAIVGDIKQSSQTETLKLTTPKKGSKEAADYVWKINQEIEGTASEPIRRLSTGYLKINTLQRCKENEAEKKDRCIAYQILKQEKMKESQKTIADSKQCVSLVAAFNQESSCPLIVYTRSTKASSPEKRQRQEGLPLIRAEPISPVNCRDSITLHSQESSNPVIVYKRRKIASSPCIEKRQDEEDNRQSDTYTYGLLEGQSVLLSRVKDFIVKMNVVQGNRKFSVWKCSVVDSVVGTFLTQNTTDHNSSSAFMSLAATFPIQPRADFHTKCTENENPATCQIRDKLVDEGRVLCSATLLDESTREASRNMLKKNKRVKQSTTKKDDTINWDNLRNMYGGRERKAHCSNSADSVDWEKVRKAKLEEVAASIEIRGQHKRIAKRIKDFLDAMVKDLGVVDLEWLKDVPPNKVKEHLLKVYGLGLKSVECISLLSLHHAAFPVDTNVRRVALRLGWMLRQNVLDRYPSDEAVHKYLWRQLCNLDHLTLFELHYHIITFGKVFCTERNPNCGPCPLKGECLYFANQEASRRLSLPERREENREISEASARESVQSSSMAVTESISKAFKLPDIEDVGDAGKYVSKKRRMTVLQKLLQQKQKRYQLPDEHYVLRELHKREPDDSCPYLLAIWPTDPSTSGLHEGSSSNNVPDQISRTVPATILIPCRTATNGSFPLSGTYFQINEVFADHETSQNPINVLTESIQNLRRRLVFLGVNTSAVFRDQTQEDITCCFQQGFICVKGFDRRTRMPENLSSRFFVPNTRPRRKRKRKRRLH